MLTVTVITKVDPKKRLEFEHSVTALLEEIENSKECLGWNVFRELTNSNAYCIETHWNKKETMEKHLRSKRFKILTGAIHNLCAPPEGLLKITRMLEEKII